MHRNQRHLSVCLVLGAVAIAIALALPNSPNPASARQRSPSLAKVRLHEFRSDVFGNTRTLRVLLPPGYDEQRNSARRFPVLYLNDGQNLFDASTSMFNSMEWKVDETVSQLVEQHRIAPLIVVGIDNAGRRNRPVEYLPYPDEYLRPAVPSPQGSKYPDFLIGEVMTFINRTYRTQIGPESTGVGGSSYGAVAALYTVMSRPGVFGRLLLESPSLYISNNQLLKDCAAKRRWPDRVYVGFGTHETGDANGDREAVALIKNFDEILAKSGLNKTRLLVVIEEGATHREDAWARRLPRALEFIYGK